MSIQLINQRDFAGVSPHTARLRFRPFRWGYSTVVDLQRDTATSDLLTTTITADSVAHTKGAWSQLIASTSDDASLLVVEPSSSAVSGSNSSMLLDIGIGAAASETALISNLFTGYLTGGSQAPRWEIPIWIPKGTRLSARCQAAVGSRTVSLHVELWRHADRVRSPLSIDVIGPDTATSRGVTLTGPGSLNTKSAWTTITASTDRRYWAIAIMLGGNGSNALGNGSLLVDIGSTFGGTDTVIAADIRVQSSSAEWLLIKEPTRGVDLPTGSNIIMRYARSTASTGLDATVLGIPVAR